MCISNFKLRQATRHLQHGGLLAYPTEAVYGLGCNPLDELAVLNLLNIKQRPLSKGLILIASSLQQLVPFIKTDTAILNRINPTWPGPVTWVVPVQANVPAWLTGSHQTLAVRVTAHPLAKKLCAAFGGPLVSTSANPAGKPPAQTSNQVFKYFPFAELLIIKGETGKLKSTTPIYSALGEARYR